MDRARRASARNALPNRRGLAVEPLEARQLLSVVTVGNRAEFFFTDNAGAAQSIYVENGQARVTFADLTGGQHEIQSVQLLGRSRVRVNLDVSTSVPALTATNVGNISVGGSLDSFTVAAVFGDVSVAGSLGRLQARRVTGSVYVEGDLGDLTAASFPGDLFVQGGLVGTARLTRELGSIHVGLDYNETTDEYEPTGGLLAGILQVGLDVNELRIAASGENAVVRVGRLLRTLELAGDLAGTFEVNGGIFGGPRPEIGRAPDRIGYGGSFVVETPDAADIASVALIRLGSVTHSFNMEQRFVALEFSTSGESLTAHAPTTGAVAPPGYYMLFLVNSAGIPSVASLVQLDSGGLILAATASRDPGETVSPRILSPDAASVVRAEALDGTGPQSLDSPIRPVSHEVTDAALALDLQPTRAEQGPSAQLAAEVAWPNAPRAHHATAAWDIDDLTLASIFIDRLFGR